MTTNSVTVREFGLIKYDAMQHAIVAAIAIDEVKEIRDKALALEKYAAQALNFEAEKRVASIRIEAELRAGQLNKERTKANGARGQLRGRDSSGDYIKATPEKKPEAQPKTLAELKISGRQSSDWQAMASNPKAVQRYLATVEGVPTTMGAVAAAKGETLANKPDFSEDALWVRSRLLELAAHKIDPKTLAAVSNNSVRVQMARALKKILPRLNELQELLCKAARRGEFRI